MEKGIIRAWGILLVVLVAMAGVLSDLAADTLLLKNGNRFEGKILQETPDKVVMQMQFGTMEFKRSDIKEVKKKAGYTVPKAKPRPKPTPKPKPAPKAPGPSRSERPQPSARPKPASIAQEADLRAIPQSPFITLNAVDRPVDEILYKIARQSDRIIKWEGRQGERPRLTLVLQDAFFWDAFINICDQGRWGFTIYSQPGNPISIPGSFGAPPPRGYQVAGPLVLVWYGLNEERTFDFKQQPPKSIKVKRMALDLKVDKNSDANFADPATNPDFTFTLAGGRRVTIKADTVMQDGMGGRAWKFNPGGKLTGNIADLDVKIPVWMPAGKKGTKLPWRNGATAKAGDVNVTLEQVGQEKNGKLTARFKLGYDKSVLTKLGSLGAGVLSVHTLTVIGKGGRQIKGERGSGGGSPWGYSWAASFEVPGNFQPAHFAVTWAEGYRELIIPFKLKGIPISEKATADYKPKPSPAAAARPTADERPALGPPGEPVRVTVSRMPRPGPGMVEWAEIKPKEFSFGNVSSISFSPDGKLIAVTGFNQACVKIWSMDNIQTERGALFGFTQKLTRATFSPDGRCIAAGGWGGVIKVFDVASERELAVLKGHEGQVVSLAFSPDGRQLVSGAFGDNIKVWDMTSGKEIRTIKDAGGRAVRFSPNGGVFVSYDWGRDGGVNFWDAATGDKLAHVSIRGGVYDMCFSPDGKVLAVAAGSTIKLFDAVSKEELMTWQDDTGGKKHWVGIKSISFSPDGSILAYGGEQKLVRLWNVKTGKVLATLEGHKEGVTAVAFSPDGGTLATGDSRMTVKLWKWK